MVNQVLEENPLEQAAYEATAARGISNDLSALTPEQVAMATKSDYEIFQEFPPEKAQALVNARIKGASQYYQDQYAPSGTVGDYISDALKGTVYPIADLAAMQLDSLTYPVTRNPRVTNAFKSVENWVSDGLESDAYKQNLKAFEAASSYAEKLNTLKEEQEIKEGASPFIAGLRRVGRDIVDSSAHAASDSNMSAMMLRQGLGSLVSSAGTAGVAAKILGKAVGKNAAKAIAWPATIGGMNASGTWGDTLDEVQNIPHESLEKTSETYRSKVQEYLLDGKSLKEAKEQARIDVAMDTAAEAAFAAGDVGAAVGILSRGMERIVKAPLKPNKLTSAAKSVSGETGEEFGENTGGQLGQNYAKKEYVDPNQDLLEGVGRAGGEGAVGGALSAGAISSPGVARSFVSSSKKASGKAIQQVGRIRDEKAYANHLQEATTEFVAKNADTAKNLNQALKTEGISEEDSFALKTMSSIVSTPTKEELKARDPKTVIETPYSKYEKAGLSKVEALATLPDQIVKAKNSKEKESLWKDYDYLSEEVDKVLDSFEKKDSEVIKRAYQDLMDLKARMNDMGSLEFQEELLERASEKDFRHSPEKPDNLDKGRIKIGRESQAAIFIGKWLKGNLDEKDLRNVIDNPYFTKTIKTLPSNYIRVLEGIRTVQRNEEIATEVLSGTPRNTSGKTAAEVHQDLTKGTSGFKSRHKLVNDYYKALFTGDSKALKNARYSLDNFMSRELDKIRAYSESYVSDKKIEYLPPGVSGKVEKGATAWVHRDNANSMKLYQDIYADYLIAKAISDDINAYEAALLGEEVSLHHKTFSAKGFKDNKIIRNLKDRLARRHNLSARVEKDSVNGAEEVFNNGPTVTNTAATTPQANTNTDGSSTSNKDQTISNGSSEPEVSKGTSTPEVEQSTQEEKVSVESNVEKTKQSETEPKGQLHSFGSNEVTNTATEPKKDIPIREKKGKSSKPKEVDTKDQLDLSSNTSSEEESKSTNKVEDTKEEPVTESSNETTTEDTEVTDSVPEEQVSKEDAEAVQEKITLLGDDADWVSEHAAKRSADKIQAERSASYVAQKLIEGNVREHILDWFHFKTTSLFAVGKSLIDIVNGERLHKEEATNDLLERCLSKDFVRNWVIGRINAYNAFNKSLDAYIKNDLNIIKFKAKKQYASIGEDTFVSANSNRIYALADKKGNLPPQVKEAMYWALQHVLINKNHTNWNDNFYDQDEVGFVRTVQVGGKNDGAIEVARGYMLNEIYDSIGKKTLQYLGAKFDENVLLGDKDGLITALGMYAFSAYVAQQNRKPAQDRDITFYWEVNYNNQVVPEAVPTVTINFDNKVAENYRDLIDFMILGQSDSEVYMDKIPSVGKRDGNPIEGLDTEDYTPEQLDSLKAQNAVVYNRDDRMMAFWEDIGLDNMFKALGCYISDELRQFGNKFYIKTLESRQKSFANGWQEALRFQEAAFNRSKDPRAVEYHFKHKMGQGNRTIQVGRATYVNNKLMRTCYSPTPNSWNLHDAGMNHKFKLAVAQIYGIKVQNMQEADAIKKLDEFLADEDFQKLLDIFNKWETRYDANTTRATSKEHTNYLESQKSENKLPDNIGEIINNTFTKLGIDINPMSIQYTIELARFTKLKVKYNKEVKRAKDSYLQKLSKEEKKAFFENPEKIKKLNKFIEKEILDFSFDSLINFEPDGINNGMANSQTHMVATKFTDVNITSMAQTGNTFGFGPQSRADIIESGEKGVEKDLYEAAAADLEQVLAKVPVDSEDYRHTLNLMSWFAGGFKRKADGTWSVKRSGVKPFIRTDVYGSGDAAKVRNVFHQIVGGFNEFISEVGIYAQKEGVSATEAFNAVAKKKGIEDLNARSFMLTLRHFDPHWNFTSFQELDLSALEESFTAENTKIFGKEIFSKVAEQQTGAVATARMKAFSEAVDLGSKIFLATLKYFEQKYFEEKAKEQFIAEGKELKDSAIQGKAKDLMANRAISQKDMINLYRDVMAFIPNLDFGPFKLLSLKKELKGKDPFGNNQAGHVTAYRGTIAIAPSGYTPKSTAITMNSSVPYLTNPGVATLPNSVIGAGDGQMMNNAFGIKNVKDTANTFDGAQTGLEKLRYITRILNECVYMAMKECNPYKTTQMYLVGLNKALEQLPKEIRDQVFEAVAKNEPPKYEFGFEDPVTAEDISKTLKNKVKELEKYSLITEARHWAMEQTGCSFSNMAGLDSRSSFYSKKDVTKRAYNKQVSQDTLNYYLAKYLEQSELGRRIMKEDNIPPSDSYNPAQLTEEAQKTTVKIPAKAKLDGTEARFFSTALDVFNSLDKSALSKPVYYLINKLVRTTELDNIKVIKWSKKYQNEVNEFLASEGISYNFTENQTGICITTDTGPVLIVNADTSTEQFNRTLAHELGHAILTQRIKNAAKAKPESKIHKQYLNLKKSAENFMNYDLDSIDPTDKDTIAGLQDFLRSSLKNQGEDTFVDEFIQCALSHPIVTKYLKKRTKWQKFTDEIKDAIFKAWRFLFNEDIPPRWVDSDFGDVMFNAGKLLRAQRFGRFKYKADSQVRNSPEEVNANIKDIAYKFKELGSKIEDQATINMDVYSKVARACQLDADAITAMTMANAVYSFSSEGKQAFMTAYKLLAGNKAFKGTNEVKLTELYRHIHNNLKDTDLDKDPILSRVRYELLTKANNDKNIDRVALLGALVVSNSEVMDALNKLPDMPKTQSQAEGKVNQFMENLGIGLVQKVTDVLSGTDTKKGIGSQTSDQMMQAMFAVNSEDDGILNMPHNVLDKGNTFLSNVIQTGASKIESSTANSTNVFSRIANSLALSVTSPEKVSKKIRSYANEAGYATAVGFRQFFGAQDDSWKVEDVIKALTTRASRRRTMARTIIPQFLENVFERRFTPEEKAQLTTTFIKTDLACLFNIGLKLSDVRTIVDTDVALDSAVYRYEQGLTPYQLKKAKQLANYMLTGVAGDNLLRNAKAISDEVGSSNYFHKGNVSEIASIDALVTLYAIKQLGSKDRTFLQEVLNDTSSENIKGCNALIGTLMANAFDEMNKSKGIAYYNGTKGYVPQQIQGTRQIIVAPMSKAYYLESLGYKFINDYNNAFSNDRYGYFYVPYSVKGAFKQGAIQIASQTAGGVNISTGKSVQDVGSYTNDPVMLEKYIKGQLKNYLIIPIYDNRGKIVALQQMMEQQHLTELNKVTDVFQLAGNHRGRIDEETDVKSDSLEIIQSLYDQWDKATNRDEYVNLFTENLPKTIQDAWNVIPPVTKKEIQKVFGDGQFWVRKDQLEDIIGHRQASVTDMWTGNTDWNPTVQKQFTGVMTALFGHKAAKFMLYGERNLMLGMAWSRNVIVVRSVIVPAINIACNMYQLMGRGIPFTYTLRKLPAYIAQMEQYTKLERALVQERVKAMSNQYNQPELDKINKRIERLEMLKSRYKTIDSLVKAGEFNTIADLGTQPEDIDLFAGRFDTFFEKVTNKLPGPVKALGENILMTKNTSLYKSMEKSVQYGDFLAKAIMHDYLVEHGTKEEDAKHMVREEFVNYDYSMGRSREYLENIGLLWFYNYKFRIMKASLRAMRDKPLFGLLGLMGSGSIMGVDYELPIQACLFAKMLDGGILRSAGPGMGMDAWEKVPLVNLLY